MTTLIGPIPGSWWTDSLCRPISIWGLRDDGTAYQDIGGAVPGESAAFSVDDDTLAATLTRIGGQP